MSEDGIAALHRAIGQLEGRIAALETAVARERIDVAAALRKLTDEVRTNREVLAESRTMARTGLAVISAIAVLAAGIGAFADRVVAWLAR